MNFRRTSIALASLGIFLGLGQTGLQAINIDPSKKNVPDMPDNHNHFDLFAGDPERIQKANAINYAEIQSSLELAPGELSIYSMKEEGLKPNIRITFKIKDVGTKRTYTLGFPNAQRYEVLVLSADNKIVYKWSADKSFIETVGTTMINPGDSLCYNELLPVSDFYTPLDVGNYTVIATLANYPLITAKGILKVVPGQPSSPADSTVTPTSAPATSPSPVEPTKTTEGKLGEQPTLDLPKP